MICSEFLSLVEDHLDGQLVDGQEAAWLRHHATCPDCRRRADRLAEGHAAIAAATTLYVRRMVPLAGGSTAIRDRIRGRRWWTAWLKPALAAAVLMMTTMAAVPTGPGPAPLVVPLSSRQVAPGGRTEDDIRRLAELMALRDWQDDLARTLAATEGDRLWQQVACAYLPPARRTGLQERIARAFDPGMPVQPRVVVHCQRTVRRGEQSSELDFTQFEDGSVHVDDRQIVAGEETGRSLDAATWDQLVSVHGSRCRQLGLLGTRPGDGLGWPLPARGRLERDARRAVDDLAAPTDLARRLLVLRLASRVSDAEELDAATRRILEHPLPSPPSTVPADPRRLVEQIRDLEVATAVHRLPAEEWTTAMRCLPAVAMLQ